MLIDLHVHSRRTPGCPLDPAEVIRRAESLGLDGVCFTDTNTLAGAAELHALRSSTRLKVLVGVEVVTDHGHYLCFFPDPVATPEPVALFGPPEGGPWSVREVIEKVRARGGAIVAAHPYDREVEKPAGDFLFTLRGLHAVEGLCGRKRVNVNELAIEAADHLALPCVGGSAAARGLDELGTAATLFRDPIEDEAGLVAALRAGAVWAVAIGTPPEMGGAGPAPRWDRFEGRERRRDRDRDRRGGRRERRGGDRGREGGRGDERPAREGGREERQAREEGRQGRGARESGREARPVREEGRGPREGGGEERSERQGGAGEAHRRRRRRHRGGGGSRGEGGSGGGSGGAASGGGSSSGGGGGGGGGGEG